MLKVEPGWISVTDEQFVDALADSLIGLKGRSYRGFVLLQTLVLGFCLMFVPALALVLGALALSGLLPPWSGLPRLMADASLWVFVVDALWWSVGVHRKFLVLLAEQKMLRGFIVFCISIAGFWLFGWAALSTADGLLWANGDSDSQSQCRRGDSNWTRHALEIRYVPELNRLVASGDIGWNSARALELALQAHPNVHLLQLDSLGGLVREEGMLIDIVRAHGLDTLVLGKCVSACTGVFLAGRRRFITPDVRFGFHRAGYCGMPEHGPLLVADMMAASQLREMGVSEKFVSFFLATEYQSMLYPTPLTLKRHGVATHWWSERPEEYNRAAPA